MKRLLKMQYANDLLAIVKLINKVDKKYIYIMISTIIFTSLIPPISLKVMQEIINMLQSDIRNLQKIFIMVAIYLLIDFIQIIIQMSTGYYKNKFELSFNLYIKQKILEKAARLNLNDYENSKIYDMLQRADQQGEGQLISYFDTALGVIGLLITSISYCLIILAFRGWIVPILIIIPILRFLIGNKINRKEFNIVKSRTNDERKAWYDAYVITSGINYKELKLFNLFSHFIEKYTLLTQMFIKQDIGIFKTRMKWFLVFDILEQALIGALFAYTIYCGYMVQILIGDVITYTRSMVSAKEQVQSIISTMSTLNKVSLFINQLFEFLTIKEDKNIGNVVIDNIDSISTKHLSFRYRENDKYALYDVNLEIKRGSFIAIVGCNGSGKTTLMKILMGYYQDYEGEILINGINLKKINKECYLKKIGALFQDFTKYEGTIRENICYSNLDIFNDDNKITSAYKKFELDYLVKNQEKGIDTQLGFWFECGKQISLGQWQRIALSRAFVRDADLYFLDEPNAALDPISEYSMSKLYKKVFGNKIGIVIVHKFNNFINDANKIIVLKDGQVVGQGTHESLMKTSSEYEQLYNLQSK